MTGVVSGQSNGFRLQVRSTTDGQAQAITFLRRTVSADWNYGQTTSKSISVGRVVGVGVQTDAVSDFSWYKNDIFYYIMNANISKNITPQGISFYTFGVNDSLYATECPRNAGTLKVVGIHGHQLESVSSPSDACLQKIFSQLDKSDLKQDPFYPDPALYPDPSYRNNPWHPTSLDPSRFVKVASGLQAPLYSQSTDYPGALIIDQAGGNGTVGEVTLSKYKTRRIGPLNGTGGEYLDFEYVFVASSSTLAALRWDNHLGASENCTGLKVDFYIDRMTGAFVYLTTQDPAPQTPNACVR